MTATFDSLRLANTLRLPVFKNGHGEQAHSKPDGSDWSPAQWLQALIGELGEFAAERLAYEAGELTTAEYEVRAAKELADVQCYLDILARRCLDKVDRSADSAAQQLMAVTAGLGTYANTRKKYERGDYSRDAYKDLMQTQLAAALKDLFDLSAYDAYATAGSGEKVHFAHPHGVDLGQATQDKFNEVSKRIGCTILLGDTGAYDTARA